VKQAAAFKRIVLRRGHLHEVIYYVTINIYQAAAKQSTGI